MSDKKTKIFLRIAAAVMIASAAIKILNDLVYNIAREIRYGYVKSDFRALSANFNSERFFRVILDIMPLILGFAGAVILIVAAIMLITSKLKNAGVLIIVYAVITAVDNIGYIVVYVTKILPAIGNLAGDYMKSQTLNLIEYVGEFIILILLGLLLVGVFKNASKVLGFILTGAFAVAWVVVMIGMIKAFGNLSRSIVESYGFGIFAGFSNIVFYSALCMTYIAFALCSLGIALKPREKTEIPPDNSVIS